MKLDAIFWDVLRQISMYSKILYLQLKFIEKVVIGADLNQNYIG